MRIRVQIPRIYIKSQARSWGWLSRQKHQLQKASTRNNWLVQYRKQPKALHMMANRCDPSTPTLRCQVGTGALVIVREGQLAWSTPHSCGNMERAPVSARCEGRTFTRMPWILMPLLTHICAHTQTQSEAWQNAFVTPTLTVRKKQRNVDPYPTSLTKLMSFRFSQKPCLKDT